MFAIKYKLFCNDYINNIRVFISLSYTKSFCMPIGIMDLLSRKYGKMACTSVTKWSPASDCLFVACLTSQQQASVSQGRICSDNFTCCHTEIEVADPTFYLAQSQYTDTGPTSPSADPISITPGAWQGSHWSANF